MKEVKYIPGDLVEINNRSAKLLTISSDGIEYLFLGKNGHVDWETSRDEIQPLPLTQEILEKNGWKRFVYDDDIFHEIELNCYSTLVVYFPQKDKKDISCGIFTDDLQGGKIISFFPTEIEYVHQLQHLLFGLGLDSSLKV